MTTEERWTTDQILRRLAPPHAAGEPVDAPAVQAVVADHHDRLTRFRTPDRASYTGLGALYADDQRFADQIDAHGAGLSGYLRDAIAVYAAANPE